MKKKGIETDRSSFFQEPEGTPKSFIQTHSDYESDGEDAFPEVEVRVSIKKYWKYLFVPFLYIQNMYSLR